MTSNDFNQLATVKPGTGMSAKSAFALQYPADDEFGKMLGMAVLRLGRKFNSQPRRRAPEPAPWYRRFDRR